MENTGTKVLLDSGCMHSVQTHAHTHAQMAVLSSTKRQFLPDEDSKRTHEKKQDKKKSCRHFSHIVQRVS